MSADPVQTVLDALEAIGHRTRRSGNGWAAQCPVHEDRNPSLSINLGDNGSALLFCHANPHDQCTAAAIADALGLTMAQIGASTGPQDQWRRSGTSVTRATERRPSKATGKPAKPKTPSRVPPEKYGPILATYPYRDEDGHELYRKYRYGPTADRSKTFRVYQPDGLTPGIGDARKVLYRLPEVKAAIQRGQPVLLVEGEKDADRAVNDIGIAATTTHEGAGSGATAWREEYTEQLRGANVLIIADRDDPGIKHAKAAAAGLRDVATNVRIALPAVEAEKADLSDHLDAGYSIDQVVLLEPDGALMGDEPKSAATPEAQRATTEPLPTLPDEFWNARPTLKHIRQAAHARGRCADLVLHAVMARTSGMVSHELLFDSGLGLGSLNFFSAIVGPSGMGKSTGSDAAGELVVVPRYLRPADGTVAFRDGLPVGSGEGLAEAYMGASTREIPGEYKRNGEAKTEKVRAQVRHNAFVYVDEGEALLRMAERSGTTIGPTLRSAWAGQLLGQANARDETTRILAARSYALGVLIGFQQHTCQALLSDATAGTPQRFLWCSAVDTAVPDVPPAHPGRLTLRLEDGFTPISGTIRFSEDIKSELWARNLARVRGEATDAELDSHMSLMLCKVAALLAVMDGRLSVNGEDWDLARVMWDTSCRVRDELLTYGRRQASREAWIRDQRQVELEVRKAAEVSQVGTTLERLAGLLERHVGDDGALTHNQARHKLASRDRSLYQAAVDHAESRGGLRRVEGGICRPLRALSGADGQERDGA